MAFEFDFAGSRRQGVPSLVQSCQRVASAHVEGIWSLGESIRFDLVKPILQSCSAETLLRLEQTSPHFTSETSDIWKALCFRTFPLAAEQRCTDEPPKSWRDEYFVLKELEVQRLEQVGNKLRSQREEVEQRRNDRQVKYSDNLPPPKRPRTGWGPSQPKTLIQKTLRNAAKLQKGVYSARTLPSARGPRAYSAASARMIPPTHAAATLSRSAASSNTSTRVAAATSSRTPSSASTSSSSQTAEPNLSTRPALTAHKTLTNTVFQQGSPPRTLQSSPPPSVSRGSPPAPSERALKVAGKKDPKAALFMPKHRAHSQLPPGGVRSRP